LPNLLNCQEYRRVLSAYVQRRLETIDGIAQANFQDIIDSCDGIDVVFACDDSLKRNFRLNLYPEYKANRLLMKRQYQLGPIKDYLRNVLFKELKLEEEHGYKFVQVEGAEGDDVIATALTRLRDRYDGICLIASDHDFLQVDGVREFDLFGREARRELGKEEVSAPDFLLGKILMGDRSDNIKQVFSKCGPKTALALTKDKECLKRMLNEDAEAARRFLLNKKIISFGETPKELVDSIERSLNEALYEEEVLNKKTDLKSFMDW
jgi:5'-3' exonuclease